MTPEDLERLVAQADFEALANACESLTEADRRRLSTTAAKLERQIENAWLSTFTRDGTQPLSGALERLSEWIGEPNRQTLNNMNNAVRCAMLAVCPFSKVKKVGGRHIYSEEEDQCLVKILSDRRPDWIDEWIIERLKSEWKEIDWLSLRALIKRGICKKPTSDGYIELMASSMPGYWGEREEDHFIPLSAKLLAEPDLLKNEVWRLFEVDTAAFKNESFYKQRASPEYETWAMALKRLTNEGHLDRNRLLDSTLSGLSTGLKSNTLAGYAKFHDSLSPTSPEMCARQQTYLDLISSQTPAVVTFALRNLKSIEKEGKLDAPAFVRCIGPVLCGRQKTQPKAALTLLKRIASRHPDLAGDIAMAASEALMHESPEIQEQSLKLLDSLNAGSLTRAKTIIADRLIDVSASCRSLADGLTSKLGIDTVEQQPSDNVEELEQMYADLIARAQAVEPQWRRIAGIDKTIEAVQKGEFPPPLDYDLQAVPVLTGIEPIVPIETVDELIESVSHAVEEVDSADEIERILDGISRLCNHKPANFERLTAPLTKRIRDRRVSQGSRGLIAAWGTPENLLQVLEAWLRNEQTPIQQSKWAASTGPRAIWNARLAEIASRVLHQQSIPLLAAPTHMYGWIDPRRFVERVLLLQEANAVIPRIDLIQALLRLAPEYRSDALSDAASIDHDYGRIIRWALGGEDGPNKRDKKASAIWLAAGRCRSSKERLMVLSKLRLDSNDRDVIEPAIYQWRSFRAIQRFPNKTYYYARIKFEVSPKGGKGENSADQPTAALHGRHNQWSVYGLCSAWLHEWVSMVWPANPDAMLKNCIEAMIARVDDKSSIFDPNHAFLHPLFVPDLPLSEMARLALWVGLISRDTDARGTAIDVLVQAIQDGRAHPDQFGELLVKLASGDCVKMNRACASLAEIARLSSFHARFAYHVLDMWLASLDSLPRDGHYAVELLLELKTQLGLPLTEKSRGLLSGIKGSSKSAKAAKILREPLESKPSPSVQEALLTQLEFRIERAERWANVQLGRKRTCPMPNTVI